MSRECSYSDKLDTEIKEYQPEFQEVGLLFLDYLKSINDEDCKCRIKSQILLQKVKKYIRAFAFYEFFILLNCILIVIIYHKFEFNSIFFGTLIKLFMLVYLQSKIHKEKKYVGQKSTLTRTIFLRILFQDLSIQRKYRIKLYKIDQNIANKLTMKILLREIVRKQYAIVFYIIVSTLLNGISAIQFIITANFQDKLFINTLPFNVLLPIAIIVITLVTGVLFILLCQILQLLKIIFRMFSGIPKLLMYCYKIKIEKLRKIEKLNKYKIQDLQENENCSICFCKLQNSPLQLPCQHYFHQKCLANWFETNNSCPICRGQIEIQ